MKNPPKITPWPVFQPLFFWAQIFVSHQSLERFFAFYWFQIYWLCRFSSGFLYLNGQWSWPLKTRRKTNPVTRTFFWYPQQQLKNVAWGGLIATFRDESKFENLIPTSCLSSSRHGLITTYADSKASKVCGGSHPKVPLSNLVRKTLFSQESDDNTN